MKKFILVLCLLANFGMCEAATLTTEIARVREYIYQTDSTNSTITDALVTEAINTSQDMICNLLSYSSNYENILTSSMSFTTGAVTLTNPTAFKKIVELFDSNGKPYIQIKPEESHRMYLTNTTKDPVFSIEGSAITFSPAATASGTMYMKYLKGYPKLASGSDVIAVQDRFLNLLTIASAWYILAQDNQSARAGALKQLLTDLITIENQQMINSNVIEKTSSGVK